MEVSVVIVNWNTKRLLVQCLESVYREIKGAETEVFVVDNGSTDGSTDTVRKEFSEVILIENPENLGFAKANNQALRMMKGRYALLLNPDAQIKEGSLEVLKDFMNKHLEVAVAGAQLLHPDGSKQNSIANFPTLATELLNKSLLRRFFPDRYPGKEKDYLVPLEVESVIGACMMVRREAIDQVGPLDEDYFLFFEETDWCYRMRKGGWKVYHVPQAEVVHYQGKSAEIDKKRAKVEYYRSRYLFFKKNRGIWQWWVLLIGGFTKLALECIGAAFGCFLTAFAIQKWRTKFSIYIYLLWWHLRGCPEGMGLKQRPQN